MSKKLDKTQCSTPRFQNMEEDNGKKAEEEAITISWNESSEAIDNEDAEIANAVECTDDIGYSQVSSHSQVDMAFNEKQAEESKSKILRNESSETIDNEDAEIANAVELTNDFGDSQVSGHWQIDPTINEEQAEKSKRNDSLEAIDDVEITNIVELFNDSISLTSSSYSIVDMTNNSVEEEDNFSQLKTKNTQRRRLARQAPGVFSQDFENDEPLENPLNNHVASPKTRNNLKRKVANESQESDVPTTSKGRRKKQRLPNNENTSTPRESDGLDKDELSDSSIQSVQTFSSVTTESLGSFIQNGSDDSLIVIVSNDSQAELDDLELKEFNNPGCSDKNKVGPKKRKKANRKKYRKLRYAADISDDDENAPKEEAPMNIVKDHEIMYKYKRLKKIIFTGKAQQVRDIIYKSYDDLDLPIFSELLWAVVTRSKKEMEEKAMLLIRAGVDVNLGGPNEYLNDTLLHVVVEKASKIKHENLAFTLMQFGADINRCNGQGNTALFCAVKSGSYAIVEELMRRDVKVDEHYNRILRLAAENSSRDSTKILVMLIDYKADDKDMKKERAMYALRWLVKNGNDLTSMRALLDYGLPFDQQDDDGQTLLHCAVIESNVVMVELLLEYGANPSIPRRDGTLPLWHAAGSLTSTIAGLLIKYGASVHEHNHLDGQYPLHRACNVGSSENIKLLLHFGANVNVSDFIFAWTPFGMVNNYDLNDANVIIIRRFAFLRSKGAGIDNRDIKKIAAFKDFRIYYSQCLGELEKMKDMVIFEKVSVYCILDYDIGNISRLIGNSELIDKYHAMKDMISRNLPNYTPIIRERMKIAWSKRNKLGDVENAMKAGTNSALPAEVFEKIAYFACRESLIDFDLDAIRSGCI